MNKPISRLFAGIAVTIAAVLAASCGGGGAGDTSGPGTLRVSVTDAPSCGYEAVYVTVSKVSVNNSATAADDAAGWSDIAIDPPKRIDLLTLTNGVLLELGQVALPAGKYQQIRLVLVDNGVTPLANAVMPTGASQTPLDTPSGQQSGLKLKMNVDVSAGETVDVVLDFDACKSVVRAGNSGKYILKPVIAVIPMISVGSISGYAAAAAPAPASGVTVSAQVNGTVVKATNVVSGTQFKLSPIAAGTYDVVFTAGGQTTRVVTGVPVYTAGETVMSTQVAPVMLPSSTVGGVGGTVMPVLALAHVRALQSISVSSRVEAGSTNADGLTGGYSLVLPTAAIEVTSPVWPAPPITTPPAYVFSAVAGSSGSYAIEASALGYLTSTSPTLAIPSGGNVTQDFTLTATP